MIKLFADDTKVFATVNNEKDKNSLQGDIDKLMNWSDTWLLKFNKSKCGVTFYPNTPKYTQMQLQIILFLLFWDVLWIFNDLLAPLSLFFHEFQQNSQVFTDLGRVAYNHEYTQIYITISYFKSLIYINYFYILTEILILKTILVCLKLIQLI